MVYTIRFFILLATIIMLTACSLGSGVGNALDSRQNIGLCPLAGSVYDSSRIVKLVDDDISYDKITYTGDITDVRLVCRYAGDDPVQASLDIHFDFGKGPSGLKNTHDYTYWVAVTRPNGTVLEKAYFTITADFKNGPASSVSKTIQPIVIPRANRTISGANFEILTGFKLTPEQLQFNREGQRFRLDAASSSSGSRS